MGEDKDPFRFLSDAEFKALDLRERTLYLARASQELELRQKWLRAQLQKVREEQEKA